MRLSSDKIAERIFLAVAFSAIASLVLIAGFILKEGLPFILRYGPANFLLSSRWDPPQGHFGIYPMIVASLWVTVGAMLIGGPLGVAGAVFLTEFVPRRVMRIVKPTIELLAGIPSVVYGFIGVMVLAPLIRNHCGGPGLSVLAASVILGIMVLPTIVSISSDAIAAVPASYREGALALGATRWQAVSMVVLKAARTGIVASVILAMGRAVGETMAVIMVAGNTIRVPHGPLESVRTLTSHIAMEMGAATGLHRQALFATGVVLFVVIMALNAAAMAAIRRKGKAVMRVSPRHTQAIAVGLLGLATLLTLAVLAFIIGFVLEKGLPGVTWTFLTAYPDDMGRAGGIFPFLIGSLLLPLLALAIALPLGVGTAVYLCEYTRESRTTRILRFGTDCLAGIPSIIFGLFGLIFFVVMLGMGWSLLSGGLTLAIMILPTIIRTSEEAIRAVPHAYREVSCSMGATRWETVRRVVLPGALPGIVTGVMLSVGRCIGETAAVIFTAGSAESGIPVSPFDSVRTLAVHFYLLATEGISVENAYATAAVLVISVLLVNLVAYWLMHTFIRRRAA